MTDGHVFEFVLFCQELKPSWRSLQMDRKPLFYGAPLRNILPSDRTDNQESSSSARRARFYQQQTVRDAQGRQRFHGAFTGGFSAGYFNTVDSISGFQPKQFISHRTSKEHGGSTFKHNPEDYMDDEDLGEFGIAPKKIRIQSNFASERLNEQESSKSRLIASIKPVHLSFGERILLRLIGRRNFDKLSRQNRDSDLQFSNEKLGHHGIGYAPLTVPKTGIAAGPSQSERSNPLIAVMSQGKRIKISGEAFGTGVLEEDDDVPTYGIDDISNYEFDKPTNHPKTKGVTIRAREETCSDSIIPGFKLSTKLAALHLDDANVNKFPCPSVPEDWSIPSGSRKMENLKEIIKSNTQLRFTKHTPFELISSRFTTGSMLMSSESMETKTGLVKYADLKATNSLASEVLKPDHHYVAASITRKITTWEPCSLLCKRFNLQAPTRKDNLIDFASHDLSAGIPSPIHTAPIVDKIASRELRRSIFNVRFVDDKICRGVEPTRLSDCSDDDNEPQFVELIDDRSSIEGAQDDCDTDSDEPEVVIIDSDMKLPEIIEITNSSDSSPSKSLCEEDNSKQSKATSDSSDSEYGPPLPPTLETLMSLNRRHGSAANFKAAKKAEP